MNTTSHTCPHCQTEIVQPSIVSGSIQCPHCKGSFIVDNKPKKKLIVRWHADYETIIEVPFDVPIDSQAVKDEAVNIPIDVPGSEYQTDTWEVESIKEFGDKE